METEAKKTDKVEAKPHSTFSSPIHLLLLLMILVILGALAFYLNKHRNGLGDSSNSKSSITLLPSNQKLDAGQSITISVWEDSGSVAVNAVEADIQYPTDMLQFISVDNAGSAFDVQAQSSEKNGTITIAKGHIGQVTGKNLIAKINLKAKQSSGDARLKFIKGTQLLSLDNHSNILGNTPDGVYMIASPK